MGLATKKPHEGLLIVYDQGEGHLLEKLPLQSDDRWWYAAQNGTLAK